MTEGEVVTDYRADLFSPATVDLILGHYGTLLADAVARPDTPVADLELLGADERHRILHGWNDTAHDVPALTWPRMFADQVAARPDETALIHEDVRLTYAELDARAAKLAHALVARGAGPEQVVALAVPRSADMIVAEVAVLKSGAAYLPVDTDYPADRIAYMLADARPVCLVTTAEIAPDLPPDLDPLVLDAPETLAELAAYPAQGPSTADELTTDHAAYVIYTSAPPAAPRAPSSPTRASRNSSPPSRNASASARTAGSSSSPRPVSTSRSGTCASACCPVAGWSSSRPTAASPAPPRGLRERARHHVHDPAARAPRRHARGRPTPARGNPAGGHGTRLT